MKRVFITLIVISFLNLSALAQIKGQDYVVEKNGDIMISQIVDGLAFQKNEILSVALKYMEDAYKDTKYKIVINSLENGVVAGEGEYLQFHEDRIFPSSYFLNAPITLRVDAKDGRARISVILSYYTGKRTNINTSEDIRDRISEYQPVNESQTERRKLYNAAFPVLFQKAQKTLKEVEEVLKSTRSSIPDTDW
ncbi:MAG: hypothetical protein SPL50_00725 [Alloprevotella sp.]|nr:hypothetical protein [Alloprevotella sp.]